jgi:hypothetical protein
MDAYLSLITESELYEAIMARKQRISRLELERLVSEGQGVSQMARTLSASKSSISERCKRLGLVPPRAKSGSKAIVLSGSGDTGMKRLDPVNQLQKINALSIEILNKAVRVLRKRGGDSITDPLSACLRSMREIRSQILTQFSIAERLYDLELREAEREFREEVLEIIGEVSEDVRAEIIKRLKERRLARKALERN